jgi:hypothetical protein
LWFNIGSHPAVPRGRAIQTLSLEALLRELYFHEDDYCQLELVAEANGRWCAEQMGRIDEFAAAHKAEVGWTDILVRSESPTPLSSLAISRSQFIDSMPSSMRPFDRIFTGYGTTLSECRQTIAFGPHHSLVAHAELDAEDIVSAVWFTFDLKSPGDVAIATDLTHALSRWPALIADWGWSQLIRLTDVDALTQYFSARVEVFSHI